MRIDHFVLYACLIAATAACRNESSAGSDPGTSGGGRPDAAGGAAGESASLAGNSAAPEAGAGNGASAGAHASDDTPGGAGGAFDGTSGTGAGGAAPSTSNRVLFDRYVQADSGTSEIVTGPVTLSAWAYVCQADCIATGDCGTAAPECELWLSDAGCQDMPPQSGSSLLDVWYPKGIEGQGGTQYEGMPLDSKESLCLTVSNGAWAIADGWGARLGNEHETAAERVTYDVFSYGPTTEPIAQGALTIDNSFFGCVGDCSGTGSDCTSTPPECTYWLSSAGCTDAAPGKLRLDSIFPNGYETLQGFEYAGFPLELDESLCVTVSASAMAITTGLGTRAASNLDTSRREQFAQEVASDLETTKSIVEGPLTLGTVDYLCAENCSSSPLPSKCDGLVPECQVFIGTAGCTGKPLVTLDTLFPLGTESFGHDYLYDGLPLGTDEALCVTTKDSASFMTIGWGDRAASAKDLAAKRQALMFTLDRDVPEGVAAFNGPLEVREWQLDCSAPCVLSDAGCKDLVPQCDVWLSTNECHDAVPGAFRFETEYPLGRPIGGLKGFSGITLGVKEAVCVSTRDSAIAQIHGWGLTPSSTANATARRLFSSIHEGPEPVTTPLVSGPITLGLWGMLCDESCPSEPAGCGSEVPECQAWLSTEGCSDAPPGSFDFGKIFPHGSYRTPMLYFGLPLAAHETVCVTSNLARAEGLGWGLADPR